MNDFLHAMMIDAVLGGILICAILVIVGWALWKLDLLDAEDNG